MKKKLLAILVIFALIVSFKTMQNTVFAETINVSGISSIVKVNNSEAEKNQNGSYVASYNSGYSEHVIELTLFTTPTDFIDLTATQKSEIYSRISWQINGETLVFTSGKCETEEFIAKSTTKDLLFTPLVPQTWTITASADDATHSTTIISNYADPESITITSDNPLVQKYEEFEPITLTATLNPEGFVDQTKDWTYIWSLDSVEIQNGTSNTLTLTQEQLNYITTYTVEVTIAEKTTAYGTQQIEIYTDLDYTLTLTQSGGSLEQVLGENPQTINFTASLPINEDVAMNWYIKYPNSYSYTKLTHISKTYTFNPSEYIASPGQYKIFAEAIYQNNRIVSQVYTITLKAKEVEQDAATFTIQSKVEANTKKPDIQAYKLSINANSEYDENQFIWFVNGSRIAVGTSFIFEPETSSTYIIEVKLLNSDGTLNNKTIANKMHLKVENVATTNYTLIFSLAGVGLIVLFVGIIVISNKTREKIW